MEKTSAPGTTVWLHLRPAAGDLIWGSDPNFAQGPLPAGSVTERKDRSTIPSYCSGKKPRQSAMWLKTWPTDTCCHRRAWPGTAWTAAEQREGEVPRTSTLSWPHLKQCLLAHVRNQMCLGNRNHE